MVLHGYKLVVSELVGYVAPDGLNGLVVARCWCVVAFVSMDDDHLDLRCRVEPLPVLHHVVSYVLVQDGEDICSFLGGSGLAYDLEHVVKGC